VSAATIRKGLSAEHRAAAISLYWRAFGNKLGRILGPEPRALAYLDRVLLPDHLLSAVSPEGRLLGIAGFRMASGAFAIGRLPDLVAVYGRAGALWRFALIRLMPQEVAPGRFRIDGLAVGDAARGQGIGAALIAALCDEARRRGFAEIRLDVADANARARALYEREGFVACGHDRMGPLRLIFGFAASTRMVRQLA
jgi:ribosomal protein S18 acetylase RimI-like enzyme